MTATLPPAAGEWAMTRLDRVASVSARIGWKALTADEYVPEGFAFLATPNIKSDQIDFENVNFITEFRYEESPELKLRVGDVLLVKDGNTLGITNLIRDLPRAATVNGSIAVIRTQTMVPAFLRYVLASDFMQGRIAAYRAGMGVPHLFQADIRKFPLPEPPRVQQQAIADYLDAETERIDGIMSARTKQLALFGEHLEVEAATLLHASGAPLVALRRIVDLLPGFSYRSEEFLPDAGHARLLRGINVDAGTLRWDEVAWIDDRVATATSRFALAAGDIVLGMDRPVISSGLRLARVAPPDLPAYLVQRVARLRARAGLSQDYLYQALRGPGLADHFAPVFTGVSVPHVSPSQIVSYEIPLPPAAQQDEVVRELVSMQEHGRAYEASARRQIELLAERRQALITAAVTGQLHVPGLAA